jgi:hypothetical protein
VVVRLVGVLSHFIYLEDARNHKPKVHRSKTSKEHLRVQEHQIKTAQDNSSHLVQQQHRTGHHTVNRGRVCSEEEAPDDGHNSTRNMLSGTQVNE